jgi:DNA replication and repair protein RecF
VFTPDDLSLAKGSAERRREGLDALGSQLSRAYGLMRTEYSRVVRQRNALLREGGGGEGLAAWDSQLVALGSKLVVQRRRLARRLGEAMIPAYEHLGDGEELAVGYLDACGLGGLGLGEEVSQEAAAEAMEAELVRRRLDERARGVTLVGPHRDDLLITIDGREARTFGSQGQQRTAALAWKMAEVIVAKELLRRSPVLLLDDVMSELDERRRSALTDVIQRETQTFVTTTNTGYFEPALLRSAEIVRVGGEA